MPSDPARRLYAVDDKTGEFVPTEDACPHCAANIHALDELTRKYHGLLSQLGALRADRDAEARGHQLWPQGVALYIEYKVATGKTKTRWTSERFWLAQPYLQEDGFVICRWAVWGVAYEPNRKTLPSGLVEVYNDFELCFRNRGTFERYARRGWANPEARRQFSLREMGAGEDDERTNPNLYFEKKA